MDFSIGTVDVAFLVLAITQAVKAIFGVEGKANQIVALLTGILLVGVSYGMQEGLIDPAYIPHIKWAVTSLAGGLSAIGLYEFIKPTGLLGKIVNGK
jgi:hypothetical protein